MTPSNHFPLNGEIYDLRLYDEVLSPKTIAEAASEITFEEEVGQK